jgi:hypothetical protein
VKILLNILLVSFLMVLANFVFAQCPAGPGSYTTNTALAFGDNSPTETCVVAGNLTLTKSPSIALTNSGRFVIGVGNVGSGSAPSTAGNLTATGNSALNMTTSDSLIIWGNLTMEGNGNLNITSGTLYIYGSLILNGNATFGAGGTVIIRGDLTVTGNNAPMTVDGGFSVGGTADLGNNPISVSDGAVFKAASLTNTNITVDAGGTAFVANGLSGFADYFVLL